MSAEPNDVLAVCTDCPALAEGATTADLTPLLTEHHARTGHRLWAISPNNRRESP